MTLSSTSGGRALRTHLCALHELKLQGRGREQRLQGQAAGAVAGQGGAALCSLHHLAHGLLQILLVRDGDQVCFSAHSMLPVSLPARFGKGLLMWALQRPEWHDVWTAPSCACRVYAEDQHS